MSGSLPLQPSGGTVIELRDIDPALLDVADRVCSILLRTSPTLQSLNLMLVGAHCRDILHASQDHTFSLIATDDVDFGVALANWTAFDNLTANLERAGHTGVRFTVGGVPIDLVPFGDIEYPAGVATPEQRDESLNVWAFQETFDQANVLTLPTAGPIRIPTVPGFVALKLAAWLDRSVWGRYKDAGDLAAAMHWYAESSDVFERLYADDVGADILVKYDVDPARGAIHILGQDVADLIGPRRHSELITRWPGVPGPLLPHEMNLPAAIGWPSDVRRRLERLNAFESGLGLGLTQVD
jgi:predicted nucleotidyltransferase